MKVAKKIKALPDEKKAEKPLSLVQDDGPRTLLDNKQLLIGQKVRLQRECDFYRKKIEQLRFELDDKENQLASHSGQVEELENVKNRLMKEIFEQEERGKELTQEIRHQQDLINADVEAKRKELNDIQKSHKIELDKASHELNQIENSKKELKNTIAQIENDILGQEKALKGIQTNVDDKKRELNHLVKEHEETQALKENLFNEINNLKITQEKYESKILELGRKEAELLHDYEVESERIAHEHELERQSFEHEKQMRFKALNEKIRENEAVWEKEYKERKQRNENEIRQGLHKADFEVGQKIKGAEELARKMIEEAQREGQRIRENAELTVQDAYKERQRLYDEASKVKLDAVDNASKMLKDANQESESLRSAAIARMSDADSHYRAKCKEAEIIVNGARAKGSLILQNAEHEKKQILKEADNVLKDQKKKAQELEDNFKQELDKRKISLHSYIEYRKERHESYLKQELKHFEQKLAKAKKFKDQELETLKRKEFKRIAHLKSRIITESNQYVEEEKEKFRLLRKAEMEKLYHEKREIKKQIDMMKNSSEHELMSLKNDKENEIRQIERQQIEQINLQKIEAEKEIEEMRSNALRELEEEKKEQRIFLEQEIMSYLTHYCEKNNLTEDALAKIQEDIKEIVKDGGKNRSEMMAKAGVENYSGPKKNKRDFIIKYGLKMALPILCIGLFAADVFSMRTELVNQWIKIAEQRKERAALKETQIVKETREAKTFRPEKTTGHKKNYVDNVIYTQDFVNLYEKDQFQNDWLLAAYGFISNELELSEQLAIDYVSLEGAFIKELEAMAKDMDIRFVNDTIAKMREREVQTFHDIEKRFSTPENWKAFLAFRDQFYSDKFNEVK